jgi:ABC-type glycerol-3-phosphate transport system permease component
MGKRTRKIVLDVITYALLTLGALLMIAPFWWMVTTAFKLPANQYTKTLLPNPATLNNFRELLGAGINFPLLFFNSFLISILTVLLGAVIVRKLPFEQYPFLAPPNIRVTATYPGASAANFGQNVARVQGV